MVKSELIKAVAEKTGATQKATVETLDAVLETITEQLVAGESVKLSGFGAFEAREVAERQARNPQDGSEIVVPAHKTPKFKASAGLKAAVR